MKFLNSDENVLKTRLHTMSALFKLMETLRQLLKASIALHGTKKLLKLVRDSLNGTVLLLILMHKEMPTKTTCSSLTLMTIYILLLKNNLFVVVRVTIDNFFVLKRRIVVIIRKSP